jgi:hypothetical protein
MCRTTVVYICIHYDQVDSLHIGIHYDQVDSLHLLIPHFLLLRLLLRALLPFDCGMGSSVASCISAPPSD